MRSNEKGLPSQGGLDAFLMLLVDQSSEEADSVSEAGKGTTGSDNLPGLLACSAFQPALGLVQL